VNQATEARELHELSSALVTCAGRLVRAVSRRTSPGIPAATLRLLSQVEELQPIAISQLAVADRCSQPTMSAAVRNLADKGWVSKRVNPADARSSFVALTDAGLSVLRQARRRNAAVVAARMKADPRHTTADLAAAVALLQHLLEHDPDQEQETP
jgi:DNA-binding MarR family transcriptional regulator